MLLPLGLSVPSCENTRLTELRETEEEKLEKGCGPAGVLVVTNSVAPVVVIIN